MFRNVFFQQSGQFGQRVQNEGRFFAHGSGTDKSLARYVQRIIDKKS